MYIVVFFVGFIFGAVRERIFGDLKKGGKK